MTNSNESLLKISELILLSAEKQLLKKAVLSKPLDKTIQKVVLTKKLISGKEALQAESFHKDNKVTHKNIFTESITEENIADILSQFKQVNLITTLGECELRISSSEKITLLGDKKLEKALASATRVDMPIEANNREKSRILSGNEPFLKLLGVSDENGRVFDKNQ